MSERESNPTPTSGRTVLVVDDEQGLADLYAAWLEGRYTVRTAYRGEAALERIDDDVDVVLLDRRMPGMSGGEVLNEINERGFDCLVVMITAVTPEFDIIEMGFDEYLTKPVSKDELRHVVDSLLDRQQYDATMGELSALLSKQAALQAHISEEKLEQSPEYQELVQRIQSVKAHVDERVSDLSTSKSDSVFHQMQSTEESKNDV